METVVTNEIYNSLKCKLIRKCNEVDVITYLDKYYDPSKFLGLCKNCNMFSKLWSCPPYEFSTKDYMIRYKKLYVISTQIYLDKDIQKLNKYNDEIFKIIKDCRKKHEKKLLRAEVIYKNSKALYSGSCLLCDKCSRVTGEQCVKTNRMRYSLESLGCDVQKTASDILNVEIKWGKDNNVPEYYTLVSGFLSNDNIYINHLI